MPLWSAGSDIAISHVMKLAGAVGITGPCLPHHLADRPGFLHLVMVAGFLRAAAESRCHRTALFKYLLGTHLVLSHWLYQVTKPAKIQGMK